MIPWTPHDDLFLKFGAHRTPPQTLTNTHVRLKWEETSRNLGSSNIIVSYFSRFTLSEVSLFKEAEDMALFLVLLILIASVNMQLPTWSFDKSWVWLPWCLISVSQLFCGIPGNAALSSCQSSWKVHHNFSLALYRPLPCFICRAHNPLQKTPAHQKKTVCLILDLDIDAKIHK